MKKITLTSLLFFALYAKSQIIGFTGISPRIMYMPAATTTDSLLVKGGAFTNSLSLLSKKELYGDGNRGNFVYGNLSGLSLNGTVAGIISIGDLTLQNHVSGDYVVGIGSGAAANFLGSESVFIGAYRPGINQTSGTNNLVLSTTPLSNLPNLTGSNQMNLGNVIWATNANGGSGSTPSSGGKVGIGTNAPDSTVHITGGLKIDNGAAVPGYVWTATNSGGAGTWQAAGGAAPSFSAITGQPTDNANLSTALNSKVNTSVTVNTASLTGDITIAETENKIKVFTEFLTAATSASPPFVFTAVSTGTSATNNTNMTGNSPGVLRLTSSTTANGGYRILTDVTATRIKGGEDYAIRIAPVNFTTTTFRAGFLDATSSTDAVDGVYFQYSTSGDLVLKAANNGTRTTSATITTLSLNTWYKLRIIINSDATSATGYVYDSDGVLIATSDPVTTNIPKSAGRECGIGVIATESTTTATAMVDLDFIKAVLTLTR